jgi:cytochrome c-type biogenesis protein
VVTPAVGYGAAFAAGLASVVSPCVLPLLPAYLSHLSGRSLSELSGSPSPQVRRQAVAHALLFVASFGAVFVALGATASALGQWLHGYGELLRRVGGALIVAFGLQLLGLWGIPARAARPVPRSGGLWQAVGLGAAFAVGWTPCVGPVLASILTLAAQQPGVAQGAALLAAYAAGLGVPFVAMAVAFGWTWAAIRRLGPFLPAIERATGAVLVVMGIAVYANGFGRLAALFAA